VKDVNSPVVYWIGGLAIVLLGVITWLVSSLR